MEASISGFFGTSEADLIDASNGSDSVSGGPAADEQSDIGDDTLFGRGGNDTIRGWAGNDSLDGGANFDQLFGGAGNDTLDGGGNDGFVDTFEGGDGDDLLNGGVGDTLVTGAGADVVAFAAPLDAISATATVADFDVAQDRIDLRALNIADLETVLRIGFNSGSDWRLAFNYRGTTDTLILAGVQGAQLTAANFVFQAEAADQDIDGVEFAELLVGAGGDDTLTGLGGSDSLFGESGDDSLDGGTGSDQLVGGAGNDTLDGGGNDGFVDTLEGGDGDDLYIFNPGDQIDEQAGGGVDTVISGISVSVSGGSEVEIIQLIGAASINASGNSFAQAILGNVGNNSLSGQGGGDTLEGGAGNDSLEGDGGADLLLGGAGDDRLTGGEGGDTASFAGALGAVIASLATGTSTGEGTDSLFSIEKLDGSAFADTLPGDLGDNRLSGGDSGDSLDGALGNDTLLGGEDRDTLIGGDGNDLLDGQSRADRLEGGLGDDIYIVGNDEDEVIEAPNAGTDLVRATVDWALGDELESLDLLTSFDLNGTGNALDNSMTGNAGANLLSGLGGADTIAGGKGDDTIVGGAGADHMESGRGAEVFRWASADEGGDTVSKYRGFEDGVEISAAGFGGGLVAGIDLVATGRYVENKSGLAATVGLGQFIYETVARALWWDVDGLGGADAVLLTNLQGVRDWTGSEISVVA